MISILKKTFQISIIFVVIFLTGCGSTTATVFETQVSSTEHIVSTMSPTTTIISKPEVTSVLLNTLQPTYTPQATSTATETRTPAPTNTPQVNIRLSEKCVTMKSSLDFVPDGALVLRREYTRFGELDILDLRNDQTIGIVGSKGYVSTIAVSPDDKQLAFIDVIQNLLQIVDDTGRNLRSIPVVKNWYSVIQWVAQDHLLIENIPLFSNGTLNPPASSVLFNLSTGKQEAEYLHGYPGQFYVGNGAPDWGPYYFTQSVFDPSFSRVVYPAYEDIGGTLVLRDIEKEQEAVHFWVGDPDFGGLPQWNQDGSYFIAGIYPIYERWDGTIYVNIEDGLPYQGGYDLFRVSRDGEVERLTYLTTKYKAIEEGYTLSPDEKLIAFWLVLDYEGWGTKVERQLAILDINTGEITKLCLSGGDVPYPPVWSPDGKYLVVTVTASDWKNEGPDVFLVDLAQGVAAKIAEQAVGVGWMLSPDE